MKHLVLSTVLAVLTLASPLSHAQFVSQLNYPEGSVAFTVELSSGVAVIHWDVNGTRDIFTLHSAPTGDLIDASLENAEPGLGYWLQFVDTTGSGGLLYHVFVNINGSWFQIEDFVL
jgi:hypothetical protein